MNRPIFARAANIMQMTPICHRFVIDPEQCCRLAVQPGSRAIPLAR